MKSKICGSRSKNFPALVSLANHSEPDSASDQKDQAADRVEAAAAGELLPVALDDGARAESVRHERVGRAHG